MFEKFIKMLIECSSDYDFSLATDKIDEAYAEKKISWQDYDLLYVIGRKLYEAKMY